MNKYIKYNIHKRYKNRNKGIVSKIVGKKSTEDKELIKTIIFFIIISASLTIGLYSTWTDKKIPLANISACILFIGSILYILFLAIVIGHDKPTIYYYPDFELKKIHLLPWVVFFIFFSCLGIIGKIFDL